MWRDKVALLLAVGIPSDCLCPPGAHLRQCRHPRLRVAIVDPDRPLTSQMFVQSIGSAPGVSGRGTIQ